MDHTCLVVPLLPGKEDELRAFYRDVEGPRQQDYDRSEQRLGITKEIAWRAPIDGGSAAVIYIESENFEQAFSQFVQSQDEFDLWFKQRVLDISGLDLNDPPEDGAARPTVGLSSEARGRDVTGYVATRHLRTRP